MKRLITVLSCVILLTAAASSQSAKLISTDHLAAMMKEKTVSVVDMRSDIATYLKGHVPGAVYLHYETLRLAGNGVPADLMTGEAYAALFSRLGFRMDQPVVIYSAGEANNFYATFLVWILDGFGHQHTFLLDGGYEKWAKDNHTIEKKYPKVRATNFPAKPFELKIVRLDAVKKAMESKSALLVDARPTPQFEGKEGLQMRLGRIPGAISHPWSSDLKQTETGKVFKSIADLQASYEQQGITKDKHILAYCNTGTEASHLYFALHTLLGYKHVKVYVPSYTEWSEREELPIETGPAVKAN
ncbi:MAG: sulfurtransferase [Ignavibacteriae bacterium]|nr:sulfurtransferase [Ignavibacteriota bacterium]